MTTQDGKKMARALRDALAAKQVAITHSQALECVAQMLGHADWNTMSAAEAAADGEGGAGVALQDAVPILRSFDEAKAKAFYVDLLGFTLDWEHRFEPGFPLYMQVSRDGLRLHVSEHHGDATPGSTTYVYVLGLDALHAELSGRGSRAGIEPGPTPNMRVLSVWDPFGNRLRFAETAEGAARTASAGYATPAT
jgi:catechol 2,3-dioxygenase-like lactoylglutathione lyase family enzyme